MTRVVHDNCCPRASVIREMSDNSLSLGASIGIILSHLLGVICHHYALLFVGPISRSLFFINPLGDGHSFKVKHIRFGDFSKSQETKAEFILTSRYIHC